MAVIAHEPGVIVALLDVVGGEIQPVGHILPIGNQRRHVVVHGNVGILVDLAAYKAEVPSPTVMRIPELGEIEGFWRGHDEEIPDAGVILHIPVG
jgi:hypothetical protein